MTKPTALPPITPDLIAPCGMNCGLCYAYIRPKNTCPGCRGEDAAKPGYCVRCQIVTCPDRAAAGNAFCYDCDRFPCRRLKDLDKRYRTKYGMSMLENQKALREHGPDKFVEAESAKWLCPDCGARLCVHRAECPGCGRAWR